MDLASGRFVHGPATPRQRMPADRIHRGRAPLALQELFEGRHFGTVVVELPPR